MMPSPNELKALAFVLIALTAAAVFRPRLEGDQVSNRIIIYWFCAALIGFLVTIGWIEMILLGISMVVLNPKRFEDRAAFFLGVVLAVPEEIRWRIDAPLINYLVDMSPALLASTVLALPLWIAYGKRKKVDDRPARKGLDVAVVLIFLATALLTTRGLFFTPSNFVRMTVVWFFLIVVPYFALSRALISREAIESLKQALLTIGVLSISIGLMSAFANWNFYIEMATEYQFEGALYRSGDVRVILTSCTTLAGWIMVAAAMATWGYRKVSNYPVFVMIGVTVLCFGVLYLTRSRGAYVAAIAMIGALIVANIRTWPLRIGTIVAGLVSAYIVYATLSSSGFQSIDQFGTFEYRDRLLAAGIAHIRENPFIGDPYFAMHPRFAPLLQGQGIIDFVNTYLQLGLQMGLLGLGLYFFMFGKLGIGTLVAVDELRQRDGPGDKALADFGIAFAALLGGYMVAIATISMVSYIGHFIIYIFGVGAAYLRLAPLAVGETAAEPAESASHQEAEKPFVIDVTPGARGWPM